jgi:hypothetical protein
MRANLLGGSEATKAWHHAGNGYHLRSELEGLRERPRSVLSGLLCDRVDAAGCG